MKLASIALMGLLSICNFSAVLVPGQSAIAQQFPLADCTVTRSNPNPPSRNCERTWQQHPNLRYPYQQGDPACDRRSSDPNLRKGCDFYSPQNPRIRERVRRGR